MMAEIFIFFGIIVAPMIVVSIFLFRGKGANLIAGYNTMSKSEKAKYDTKKLCRCTGWILITISLLIWLLVIGNSLKMTWLQISAGVIIVALCIAAVIYGKTGKYFLKKEYLETSSVNEKNTKTLSRKRSLLASIITMIIVFAGIGIMLQKGIKDPIINILEDGIQIKSMYGLTVKYSEISDISLIERNNGKDIYINFQDNMKTKIVFDEMKEGLNIVDSNN